MHEAVQHTEIEVHPDLVKHRLEPGVECLTVLAYHQGSPDGAQAPSRIGCPSREEVLRLSGHLGPSLAVAGYRFTTGRACG
jgi:hypothetical protein